MCREPLQEVDACIYQKNECCLQRRATCCTSLSTDVFPLQWRAQEVRTEHLGVPTGLEAPPAPDLIAYRPAAAVHRARIGQHSAARR